MAKLKVHYIKRNNAGTARGLACGIRRYVGGGMMGPKFTDESEKVTCEKCQQSRAYKKAIRKNNMAHDSDLQKKLRAALREFDEFSEAFDFCREADQPVRVIVAGEQWKLFPSGCAEKLEKDGEK